MNCDVHLTLHKNLDNFEKMNHMTRHLVTALTISISDDCRKKMKWISSRQRFIDAIEGQQAYPTERNDDHARIHSHHQSKEKVVFVAQNRVSYLETESPPQL